PAKPSVNRAWQSVVPEAESTLEQAHLVGGRLICKYLKDAQSQIKMFALDGKLFRQVDLPGIGSGRGFEGDATDTEVFYSFDSFNVPVRTYRLDLLTGLSKLFHEPKVRFNPEDFEVKQIFYASADGTKVPMFITHKKGIKLDGSNPTLLYGYGGF